MILLFVTDSSLLFLITNTVQNVHFSCFNWVLIVSSKLWRADIKDIEYTVSIKERGTVDLNVKRAETPLQLGMRQKLIIPSCLPWKVVTFFGKEHVNWSSISGVMIGRSWTIKFGKCKFWVPKHQFWVFQNRFFNFFLS